MQMKEFIKKSRQTNPKHGQSQATGKQLEIRRIQKTQETRNGVKKNEQHEQLDKTLGHFRHACSKQILCNCV